MTTTQVTDHDVVTTSVGIILKNAVRERDETLRVETFDLEREEVDVGWRVNLYRPLSFFPLARKQVLAYINIEWRKPKQLSLTVLNSVLNSGEIKEIEDGIAILEQQLEGCSIR